MNGVLKAACWFTAIGGALMAIDEWMHYGGLTGLGCMLAMAGILLGFGWAIGSFGRSKGRQ